MRTSPGFMTRAGSTYALPSCELAHAASPRTDSDNTAMRNGAFMTVLRCDARAPCAGVLFGLYAASRGAPVSGEAFRRAVVSGPTGVLEVANFGQHAGRIPPCRQLETDTQDG